MSYPAIKLNDRGLKKYLNHSLWFTSKDIIDFHRISSLIPPGALVKIFSKDKHFLGIGFLNPNSFFTLKLLTKEDVKINKDFFLNKFNNSLILRKNFYKLKDCFRLIFSEGDYLPGLVVDVYRNVIVVQIQTLGMERLKEYIISALIECFEPIAVVLKNDSTKRKEEGLGLYVDTVYGNFEDPLFIEMDGIKFLIPIKNGQKTGFFLDQRENRRYILEIAEGKTIIDVFSYIGGFSFYALKGGAKVAFLMDRSSFALDIAEEIAKLNNWKDKVYVLQGDAFQLLKNPPKSDLIVVDPPAFIKSKKDIPQGEKKYKTLYFLGLKALGKGMFFGFSCSYFLDMPKLAELIKSAVKELGRNGSIFYIGGQAPDHPINPFVEETFYLKGIGIFIN